MEQVYKPIHNYKVFVRCCTYNQADYIEDTLNGFAIQETVFPFVCFIMDDCSSDGEPEVIRNWMERQCKMGAAEYVEDELSNIILVPHKDNPFCTFAFCFLKRNLFREQKLKNIIYKGWREVCKYEALCEGDDYWTDSQKLAKQVQILDNNPDIVVVSHTYSCLYQDSQTMKYWFNDYPFKKNRNIDSYIFDLDNYWKRWATQPMACLRRLNNVDDIIPFEKYDIVFDIIYYYYVLKTGRGIMLKDNMGVYRIQSEGCWSGKSAIDRIKFRLSETIPMYRAETDNRILEDIKNTYSQLVLYAIKTMDFESLKAITVEMKKDIPSRVFFLGIVNIPVIYMTKIVNKIKRLCH